MCVFDGDKSLKDEFNRYGKRTSDLEFMAQIISAYEKSPVIPADWSNKEMNRIRTNIVVDHNLGVEYPEDKREILAKLQTKALGKAFANLQNVPSIFKDWLEEDFIDTVHHRCNDSIDKEDLVRFFKQTP